MIDGRTSLMFRSDDGYCDSSGCTEPFFVYFVKIKDSFYNIVFYGDMDLSVVERFILSSIEFNDGE